jgi:hypothetical protein
MKALHRDEALKVVLLCPPEQAKDTRPISAQPKWRRMTVNRKTLASALIAQLIIGSVGLSAVHWITAETQYSISEVERRA